ncbi:MAG: hypothetical protein LBJ17_03940 [Dysgonamonadaceae bacterium]|jgi:cell division protein FtsL|nr:hypothetical protein [Dysgonamonadaceae bacterium]
MSKNLLKIIQGDVLSEDFIAKNFKLIILIVLLLLAFISNRYACAKKLTKIEALKTELREVKYENLLISTEVTTHTRRSQIEKMLKQKGINLESSQSTTFKIK